MSEQVNNHISIASPSKAQSALIEKIQQVAIEKKRPDDTTYHSLMFKDEEYISKSSGVSHKVVQIIALQNNILPERYARNQRSLSNEDQIKLLNSHVVVIGLGGLGGTVTEILSRIGIGKLTLVDGDFFEDSNLNRQLLSSTDVLGKMKAEVAENRVAALNPAVEVIPVRKYFNHENSAEILADADIVVDCLDTISHRFILETGCRIEDIPLVSAAIGGTSGQVTVIFPGDPGLQLIYGIPEKARTKGIEATLGTLPYAAVAIAAMECAEVVALAIGKPAQLRKRLLLADFTYHSVETVSFE